MHLFWVATRTRPARCHFQAPLARVERRIALAVRSLGSLDAFGSSFGFCMHCLQPLASLTFSKACWPNNKTMQEHALNVSILGSEVLWRVAEDHKYVKSENTSLKRKKYDMITKLWPYCNIDIDLQCSFGPCWRQHSQCSSRRGNENRGVGEKAS